MKQFLTLLLLLAGIVANAQQFSLGFLLELQKADLDERAKILVANNFALQDGTNPRPRYQRLQSDAFGKVYEETATLHPDGSLTYSTYSPSHATDVALQLTRKYGFTNQGAARTSGGRLTNVYQRTDVKVDSFLGRDATQVNYWVFHFSWSPRVAVAIVPPQPVPEPARGTEVEEPEQGDPLLNSTNHALLIGVNAYDLPIESLRFPVADTRRLANVITEHYTFDRKNVKLLADPTGDQIINALNELVRTLTEDDNLLVFYAGHGSEDKAAEQGYWWPADARFDPTFSRSWLSNREIKDQLKRLSCRHVLVVSDACFSGAILAARETPKADGYRAIARLKSRKAITSAASTIVPDQSVFTKYLLQYLVSNRRDYLSAAELFTQMQTSVTDNSPTRQVPQYGSIREAGNEGGDFIFVRKDK